ncbi:MAG: hypothetical protein KatS3mg087_0463 [Patescibacteria group bacterium]|nr:MAG: hypothetical protein KatS3mg087_0463 [Patescibacteria group bacterium]
MIDMLFLNVLREIWTDKLFQLLMVTILTDILLGTLVSIKYKKFASNIGSAGITKKVGELIAATYIAIVAFATGQNYIKETGMLILIGMEILSILELLSLLGIKGIEKVLLPIAKQSLDEKKEKYGIKQSEGENEYDNHTTPPANNRTTR